MEREESIAAELIMKVQNDERIKELEEKLEEHLAENETLKQEKEVTASEYEELKESEAKEKALQGE